MLGCMDQFKQESRHKASLIPGCAHKPRSTRLSSGEICCVMLPPPSFTSAPPILQYLSGMQIKAGHGLSGKIPSLRLPITIIRSSTPSPTVPTPPLTGSVFKALEKYLARLKRAHSQKKRQWFFLCSSEIREMLEIVFPLSQTFDSARLTYHKDLEGDSGKAIASSQLRNKNQTTRSTSSSQEVLEEMCGKPVKSSNAKIMSFPTETRVIMRFPVMPVIH